jgi:hypothetical protein
LLPSAGVHGGMTSDRSLGHHSDGDTRPKNVTRKFLIDRRPCYKLTHTGYAPDPRTVFRVPLVHVGGGEASPAGSQPGGGCSRTGHARRIAAKRLVSHVATPGRSVQGRAGAATGFTCRIAASRPRRPRRDAGAVRCVGVDGPAPARSRPSGYVATPGQDSRNFRPCTRHGRTAGCGGDDGQHLPDRGQAADGTAATIVGASSFISARLQDMPAACRSLARKHEAWFFACLTWHTAATSARERDTGERRDAGAGMAWSRSPRRHHVPDRGQAPTSPPSRRLDRLATRPRLPPVNATRANVGYVGGDGGYGPAPAGSRPGG